MMKKVFLLFGMILLVAGIVFADECLTDLSVIPCTITQNITLDYGTFNVSTGEDVAININGDNIIIDCNNSVLYGNAIGESRKVFYGEAQNNIEIKNCNILVGAQGIAFGTGDNIYIHDNVINVTTHGIHFNGEDEAVSDNVQILNNELYLTDTSNTESVIQIHTYDGIPSLKNSLIQGNTLNTGFNIGNPENVVIDSNNFLGFASDGTFNGNITNVNITNNNITSNMGDFNTLVTGGELNGQFTDGMLISGNRFIDMVLQLGRTDSFNLQQDVYVENNYFSAYINIIFGDDNFSGVYISDNVMEGNIDLTGVFGVAGGSIGAFNGTTYNSDIAFDDVEIYDNDFSSMFISGTGAITAFVNSLKVYNNDIDTKQTTNFVGFKTVDFVSAGNTINISGNRFYNGTSADVAIDNTDNIIVQDNDFTSGFNRTKGIYSVDSSGIHILGNDFDYLQSTDDFVVFENTDNSGIYSNEVDLIEGNVIDFDSNSDSNNVYSNAIRFINCTSEENYVSDQGTNTVSTVCNNYNMTGYPLFKFLVDDDTIDNGVVPFIDLNWETITGTGFSYTLSYHNGSGWTEVSAITVLPYRFNFSSLPVGTYTFRLQGKTPNELTMIDEITVSLENNYVSEPADIEDTQVNSSVNTTETPEIENTVTKTTVNLSSANGSGIVATSAFTSIPVSLQVPDLLVDVFDVYVSSGIQGTVRIKKGYDEPSLPTSLNENELRLYAWYDSTWNLGSNQDVNTFSNEVSADFPADKLSGAPLMFGYFGGLTFTASDLPNVFTDVLGEAGHSLKVNIPLILLGLVAVGMSTIYLTIRTRLR